MPVTPIDSLADPRVHHYRDLRDRELARDGERFIAEGVFVVDKLLASGLPVDSLLLAKRRVDEFAPRVPNDVPVYVADDDVVNDILGFQFHAGVMAIGRRPPPIALEGLLATSPPTSPKPGHSDAPDHSELRAQQTLTLLILPDTNLLENLGALIRIAAAFGVTGMVLGERCADPFFRRSVRVSMGEVFRLPICRSDDLLRDLHRLRDEWRFELAATVTDADAQPLQSAFHEGRPPRLGLLLGGEGHGLTRRWLDACDRRLTIPMHLGADSLNVAVAAAVFLYELTREPHR